MPTPDGPKGQPRFDTNDDPAFPDHLTEVSEYAATVGNFKIGTKAQRQALSGNGVWEGLGFFETNTGDTYRYRSGVWVGTQTDTGWLALPDKSGNFRADNGAAYRFKDGLVHFRGQLTRVVNGSESNIGSTDGLFTMPTGLQPEFVKYWDLTAGSGSPVRARMLTTGRMEINHPNSMPTTTFVILDSIPPFPPKLS